MEKPWLEINITEFTQIQEQNTGQDFNQRINTILLCIMLFRLTKSLF